VANRSDDFNRANSTTALGSPSDGGSAWVAQSGTWGVSSNQGYNASVGNQETAVLDSGTSNVDVVFATPTVGNDIGVIARAADNSNYLLLAWTSGTGYRLFKNVAGSFTQLGSTVSGTQGAGDTIEIKADAANAITGYHNGSAIVGPVTDSAGATNTKHGIRAHVDSTTRYDTFSITDLVTSTPTGWLLDSPPPARAPIKTVPY
jgi:hypothetical protein